MSDWLKVFAAVVLMGFVSGCTSDEKGIAGPRDSVSVSPSYSTTSAPESSGAISISIDPCEILSSEDLASYGKFESKQRTLVAPAHVSGKGVLKEAKALRLSR